MRSRTSGSWPAARSSSQRAAVRRSCQTSARCSGSPLAGSQATTVSRWLAIPIAVELGALDPGGGDRLGGDPPRHLPDLAGVVLDPARAAGSAARTRSRRGRRSALARRRRGRWSRSFPGRSRGSSAVSLIRRTRAGADQGARPSLRAVGEGHRRRGRRGRRARVQSRRGARAGGAEIAARAAAVDVKSTCRA